MANSSPISRSSIEKLLKQAKRSDIESPYYRRYFESVDLRECGHVQSDEKSKLDRVQLDVDRNELIRLFGFDQAGSYFDLTISIVSLYPNLARQQESRWRLASADFVYYNTLTKIKYNYSHEQIIDYKEKRANQTHEDINVHKIGSLSLETVAPFSLSRILFNGLIHETNTNNPESKSQLVAIRLNISTHPTCDKFDYKYRFDKAHICGLIQQAAKNVAEAERLVDLLIEDRFDQPMFFQGDLERLDGQNDVAIRVAEASNNCRESFRMWGAKVKKFLNARYQLDELRQKEKLDGDLKDCLFIWAESGQQIHLTRSKKYPNLVHGMAHNSFEYASPISDIKLLMQQPISNNNASQSAPASNNFEEVSFDHLESFESISSSSYKITFRAYQLKDYVIEFISQYDTKKQTSDAQPKRVLLNKFDAWALGATDNLAQNIRWAQAKLWTLPVHDDNFSFRLASEQLLGGKGNSLVDLARLSKYQLANSSYKSTTARSSVKVSVPNGLVVSCCAHRLWLNSNPLISKTIHELDVTRRALAARSICLNPYSDQYLTPAQGQAILREQCSKTQLVLNSCPLPNSLRSRLYTQLAVLFGEQNLTEDLDPTSDGSDLANNIDNHNLQANDGKLSFAIRSSAVGEDSLETSAAGQMKTVLGARGFNAICRAVVECWSSQFQLEAVTYKTQNGLDFSLPMAVVVQELVNCHAAGVAATCNPLTGNKSQLEITANLGLGEGVVSGKQTDTIRLDLGQCLTWSNDIEGYRGNLTIDEHKSCIRKLSCQSADDKPGCCLTDEQIISLANLLIDLRRLSSIKEREVEWGITLIEHTNPDNKAQSSSSSSSSSDDNSKSDDNPSKITPFQIHLLQSRPLTNLQRLSTKEIRHELDYGISSPFDILSRANLGEVMPGALSTINCTYFTPITTSQKLGKPYEKIHTRKVFAVDSFATCAGMAVMSMTSVDTLSRFSPKNKDEDEKAQEMFRSMVGSMPIDFLSEDEKKKFEWFKDERRHPLAPTRPFRLGRMFMMDMGLFRVLLRRAESILGSTKLNDDLLQPQELISDFEQQKESSMHSLDLMHHIKQDARIIFERLLTRFELIFASWKCHMEATILSMVFNATCMKMLAVQPSYDSDDTMKPELLNDFSILMRGRAAKNRNKLGKLTESGDVGKLLDQLIESIYEDNLIDRVRPMTSKELYDFLTANQDKSQQKYECSKLFKDFISRNAHRAFKEFCFSTKTWSDDPSYIIELLSKRLKQDNYMEQLQKERERVKQLEAIDMEKLREVEAKVVNLKWVLLNYAFPRARYATIRRERTKSLIIESIHKYRQAFRHLGCLLTILGYLPDTELIFHLTIEELDAIMKILDNETNTVVADARSLLPRLIYKARRRQQHQRVMAKVKWHRPNLMVSAMFDEIEQQIEGNFQHPIQMEMKDNVSNDKTRLVKGLTSCRGCVTGRACVVSSIDEMDQVQAGDILITYSIDISWSVYFYSLAGIVTELGGIVSHGAVISREYGIPTLCTALGACSIFKTGQLVTLNADQGYCCVANDENSDQNGADHR